MRFADIWNSRLHSPDFCQVRLDLMVGRFRGLLYVLMGALPLLSVADYLSLSQESFVFLLNARLLCSLGLLPALLSLRFWRRHAFLFSLALGYSLLVLHLFLLTCRLELGDDFQRLAWFTHFSYLLLALMALFPLTVRNSLWVSGWIILVTVGVDYAVASAIEEPRILHQVWGGLLFAGVSLWAQAEQLLVLLRHHREASTDDLTRLMSRRPFVQQLVQTLAMRRETKEKCCLILVAPDRFEWLNDQYGQQMGDGVLRQIAGLLRQYQQQDERLAACRYGGAEFAVLLKGRSSQQGVVWADLLRTQVAERGIQLLEEDAPLAVTLSCGVAECWEQSSPDNWLLRCEAQLRLARCSGGNRIQKDGGK